MWDCVVSRALDTLPYFRNLASLSLAGMQLSDQVLTQLAGRRVPLGHLAFEGCSMPVERRHRTICAQSVRVAGHHLGPKSKFLAASLLQYNRLRALDIIYSDLEQLMETFSQYSLVISLITLLSLKERLDMPPTDPSVLTGLLSLCRSVQDFTFYRKCNADDHGIDYPPLQPNAMPKLRKLMCSAEMLPYFAHQSSVLRVIAMERGRRPSAAVHIIRDWQFFSHLQFFSASCASVATNLSTQFRAFCTNLRVLCLKTDVPDFFVRAIHLFSLLLLLTILLRSTLWSRSANPAFPRPFAFFSWSRLIGAPCPQKHGVNHSYTNSGIFSKPCDRGPLCIVSDSRPVTPSPLTARDLGTKKNAS
jgi:hypothetical protein